MYGLYRAWFGGGAAGSNNYPCLQDTFSPPDTVVRVGNEGEHQFVAHKGVLAAHSGYLKALLASATTTTTTAASTDGGGGSSASASCSPFDPTCATVAAVTIGQPQLSQPPVTSVSVSSVGGEAFAPLLNYMYTGRLEVTLDNVYSVLLATHLLHMPGALEQCRAALLRLRAPPALPIPPVSASSATTSSPGAAPGSILRPIPSRLLVGPPLCWPPTTSLYPPPAAPPASVPISHMPRIPSSVLIQPTAVPSSISVAAPREKQEQRAHYSASEVSRSPQSSPTRLAHHHKRRRTTVTSRSATPEIVSTVALPFVAAAAAAFTAFAVTSGASNSTTRGASSSPSRSVSPAPSSASRAHSPAIITVRKSTATAISDSQRGREIAEITGGSSCNDQPQRRTCAATSADDESSRSRGSNTNNNNNNNSSSNGDATSERDRGRSYRRRARSGTANGAKESTTSSSSSTVFSVIYDIACCDGPVRFHRVLNENYSSVTPYGGAVQTRGGVPPRGCQLEMSDDLSSENDENGGPTTTTATKGGGGLARSPSESSNDGSNAGASGSCYTCGYCKHTFKSQYCYRKHAKRHLLPTRVNETTTTTTTTAGGPRQDVAARGPAAAGRREVRLLDLNVQYYPCKICGCKFPSYYFVHKHRKLCHANDEERLATEGNIEAVATPPDHDVSASSPDRDVP